MTKIEEEMQETKAALADVFLQIEHLQLQFQQCQQARTKYVSKLAELTLQREKEINRQMFDRAPKTESAIEVK